MRLARLLVSLTFLAIVVLSVVSGPLIPGIDLSRSPPPDESIGTGTASVTVLDSPAQLTLERGSFGAGTFHLAGEESIVDVTGVEGNPYLEYRLRIPALDIVHIRGKSLYGVSGNDTLEFDAYEVRPDRIGKETYRGVLAIHLQSDDYAVLHRSNVTIRVRDHG